MFIQKYDISSNNSKKNNSRKMTTRLKLYVTYVNNIKYSNKTCKVKGTKGERKTNFNFSVILYK